MPTKSVNWEYWNELQSNIKKDTSDLESVSRDKLINYLYEISRNYERLPYSEAVNLFEKLSEYDESKYNELESLEDKPFIERDSEKSQAIAFKREIDINSPKNNYVTVVRWAMDALDLIEVLESISKLPEKYMSSVLNFSKAKSKQMRELYLFAAIKISKDYASKGDYQKAIESLKHLLSGINHYHYFGVLYTYLGYLILIVFLSSAIFLIINIFTKNIYLYISIELLSKAFLTLMLFSTIIMVLNWFHVKYIEEGAFIFGNINNIKYSILNLFLAFSILLFALLPSFFIYPLFSKILAFFFSFNYIIGYIVTFIGGFIGLVFILIVLAYVYVFIPWDLKEKSWSYTLGNGIYHYFKGRLNIQKYLESKNKNHKIKFLENAIKEFSNATEIYEESFSHLEKSNELGLCPYCLNFYLCIKDYENLVRKPEKPKIKDFEDKVEKIRIIMSETGQGSKTISELLDKLLKATKSLENLRTKSKKFSNRDSVDRANINKEINEIYEEIDDIIEGIDEVISNIEGKNLPIIIKIMEEKTKELSDLNTGMKEHKAKGFETFFSRSSKDYAVILSFLTGFTFLIVAYVLDSSISWYVGLLNIIGSIVMSFPKIKKLVY
jgi:hypothetical protein